MSTGPRTPAGATIAVAVAGLAVIGLGQSTFNRHSIEDHLTSASTQALQAADLGGVQVSFTGRDADLVVSPQARGVVDQAATVVEGVRGVRVVHVVAGLANEPEPAPGTPAPSTAPPGGAPSTAPATGTTPIAAGRLPIGLTFDGGIITVTGSVPDDAARADVIKAVTGGATGRTVTDRLTLDPALAPAEPAWYPALSRLVATVPERGSKVVARYDGDQVLVRGTPATASLERTILAAAARTVDGSAQVLDGMDVPVTTG